MGRGGRSCSSISFGPLEFFERYRGRRAPRASDWLPTQWLRSHPQIFSRLNSRAGDGRERMGRSEKSISFKLYPRRRACGSSDGMRGSRLQQVHLCERAWRRRCELGGQKVPVQTR